MFRGRPMSSKPIVNRRIPTSHRGGRNGAAIDHIVVHYTTSRNIDGTIRHFVEGKPAVSAHYIIGQDGELVQMVADTDAAWHAGSSAMNRRSIGIEHVAAPGDRITPAQERTSAALIGWLMQAYGIPARNVIPHVAIKATSCPGDLYAAHGGNAGADAATQTAALSRWVASRVMGAVPTVAELRKSGSTEIRAADKIEATAIGGAAVAAGGVAAAELTKVHEAPPAPIIEPDTMTAIEQTVAAAKAVGALVAAHPWVGGALLMVIVLLIVARQIKRRRVAKAVAGVPISREVLS